MRNMVLGQPAAAAVASKSSRNISPEQLRNFATAMQKVLENIVNQSAINDAVVRRLIHLEQKVAQLPPGVARPRKTD
jgi:hypothetical protein